MVRTVTVGLMALAITATLALNTVGAADDEKPKHTIKEAMALHVPKGGKLHEKVKDGKATDEEKAKLLEYYEAMAKNKPPKGEADSWKKLTEELVAAAKDAKEGKEGYAARLEKAYACAACHKLHK